MRGHAAKRYFILSVAGIASLLWMAQAGVCQHSASSKSGNQISSQDTSKAESLPSKTIEKNGVYQVGGDVLPPTVIYAPEPKYTNKARLFAKQGHCLISLIVDVQGKPQNIEVKKKAGMGLDKNAVAAVKQYRFKPATLNGKPVPVQLDIDVHFRIR
jgi:TonB family protein